MNKRLTRITSIFSISLLTAAMFSISSVSSTNYVKNPQGPPTEEAVELEVLSEYPELHLKRERMAPMPREYRAAISKEATDWKGYEKSLYRGKYYNKDQEHFRECVIYRESRHNYRAANKTSSARGAYQFLENNWHDGLIYMMIKESKKSKDGLIPEIKELRTKPIVKWNRYYQDRAFFTALNYNGKWSGKKHWNETVPGMGC